MAGSCSPVPTGAIKVVQEGTNWIAFYENNSDSRIEVNKMPGSHGSLTKAGKVRESTPKVHGRERHTPIPRVRNKRNYVKRFVKGQTIGVRK